MKYKDFVGMAAIILIVVLATTPLIIAFSKPDTKGPQYRCVEGYKFTKNGKTQIINEHGHGIPCSDNFVLPNTLGVR